MIWFAIGLLIFFAVHHVRQVVPNIRLSVIKRAGDGPWKGMFSLAVILGLALIILGWMQARLDAPEVYDPPNWGRHATLLLVWIAFILTVASSMPTGHIKQAVRHPMSLSIVVWSVGHLLANGDAFSVTLWGAFLLSSIWHIISAERRGDAPPKALSWRGDVGSVLLGTVIYIIFGFWFHPILFGVSPF